MFIVIVNNKIYVLGGNDGIFLNTNEVFSPTTKGVKSISIAMPPELSIYPNPTTGIVNVKFVADNKGEFGIINMLGQTVKSGFNSDNGVCSFDLSGQPPGVYNLSYILSDSVLTRRILKK